VSDATIVSRKADPAGRCPVLFVHGAWHGSWCWAEHFLDRFADAGHDAYAIDLRFHGDGTPPGPRPDLRRVTIGDYLSDIHRALAALPRTTVLVGHSMGGYLVQRYLARRRGGPGVLLAPVPHRGVAAASIRIGARHPAALAKATATWSMWPIVEDRARAARLLFDPDMPDDLAGRYLDRLQDESYTAYLGMFVPVRTRLVRSPMLVIGGSEDAIFTTGEVAATARAYGTEPLIVDGAGHDLMLGARWETVAEEILRWLAGPEHDPCRER